MTLTTYTSAYIRVTSALTFAGSNYNQCPAASAVARVLNLVTRTSQKSCGSLLYASMPLKYGVPLNVVPLSIIFTTKYSCAHRVHSLLDSTAHTNLAMK